MWTTGSWAADAALGLLFAPVTVLVLWAVLRPFMWLDRYFRARDPEYDWRAALREYRDTHHSRPPDAT